MGPLLYQMVRNGKSFSGYERNCAFLNLGQGKFADISSVSGFDFPDDGRAVALCDWDSDGDLDLWIANRTGPQVRFLRNDLETSNHFVSLKLQGETCNRDAIGARVEVTLKEQASPIYTQTSNSRSKLIKTLRAGEGFLAQSSKWMHFGLGPNSDIEKVIVRWPGGEEETFVDIQVDHYYRLIEHSGKAQKLSRPKRTASIPPTELTGIKATTPARVVVATPLPLPRFEYETMSGQKRSLPQISGGRPTLVNLWASWCMPCLRELKEFAEREADFRDAGVNVVALSVDRLDTEMKSIPTSAVELLKTSGFAGSAGFANDATIQKLQLVRQHLFDLHQPMSVPMSLLIDSAGRLVVVYQGSVTVDQVLEDIARLPDGITHSESALPFPGKWHTRRQPNSPLNIAWRLADHGFIDDSIDYISKNRGLFEYSRLFPKLLFQIGTGLLKRGETDTAVLYYREAVEHKFSSFEARNNLAWILSTHPDENLRNGNEAVVHMLKAISERPANAFSLLDTLAAAYAETGQFDEAIATATRAINMAKTAGQPKFAEAIQARLALYQLGRPYRDQ